MIARSVEAGAQLEAEPHVRCAVLLRGLTLDARIGVYHSEQGRTQPLVIDVEAEITVPGRTLDRLRPGGPGSGCRSFAPERGKGYELGVTAAWPGIDVAAIWFDIAKSGILTNDPVDPNYLAPVGRLTSRGIELDAAIKLGGRWQIVDNYAWTKARADDAAFATDAVLNVPEHAGSLFVSARFPGAEGRDFTLSAGAAYIGPRAGAIDTSGLVLPGYVKAKLGADYQLSRHASIRLIADNLFDARYAQSSYSPVWIFPGAPRTVKASLEIRY